jgi:hypothetical protein
MHQILDYVFAAVILALIVTFGITAGTNSLILSSQKVSQENLETKTNQVIDMILLTTGSPSNWGDLTTVPDNLGLASKGSNDPYVLDGGKLRRLLNGSIPTSDVRRLLSLGQNFDFTINLKLILNQSIVQINSTAYEVTVEDWKGFRVPNTMIDGYYFDSSWAPGDPFEHLQGITGVEGKVMIATSQAVSDPTLVAKASVAAAESIEKYPSSAPYFTIVGDRPMKTDLEPVLNYGSTFSTLQGGATLVTVFRTVVIEGSTYQIIFTFSSRD